ncbi:MAG: PAS domain-containing protein [Campylobacterales bacterium]
MREIKLEPGQNIISKTDRKGIVLSGNDTFWEISGFREAELVGRPHNLLRHADMPRVAFKLLWDKLKAGYEVRAFVKNRAKNGDYYWVYASVQPSINRKTGLVEGYYSIRKRARPEAVEQIAGIYEKLLMTERMDGNLKGAIGLLKSVLDAKESKFNDLMAKLQTGTDRI